MIEAVVALGIAGVIFAAFATTSMSGVRSVLVGRTTQQASDVAERALESMRALGYDNAAMVETDLGVGESLPIASCKCYDPQNDSASGSGTEPLVLDPAGGVSPHVTGETLNSTDFTVRQYVTAPTDGSGAAYKRLTVVVSWTINGKVRSTTVSTILAQKRSGLPLPDFKWTPKGAVDACVTPGAEQVFGFTLKNNGARDSWAISSNGGSITWAYYLDDPTDGTPDEYDSADDLVPSQVVGPIDPTGEVLVWAVGTPAVGSPVGVSSIGFSATSEAQPDYTQEIVTQLSVASSCSAVPTPTGSVTPSPLPTSTEAPPAQPTTCAGTLPSVSTSGNVTPTSYYLTNGSTNLGSTTASSTLPVSKLVPPSSTTLWNYSTDLASAAGRHLATSGSTLATGVEWQRQLPSSKFVGNGVLSFWAGPASGSGTDTLTFTVTVRQLSSSGTVKATLTSTTVGSGQWGCPGLKQVGVSVPFGNGNGTTFAANDILSVTVKVAGANARLGYDTTSMPAQLLLPVKSGG